MGELKLLGKPGDTTIRWDSKDPDSTEKAKKRFEKLKSEGQPAFRVKMKEEKGDKVEEFDPEAESLIMSPPISGG